MKKEILRLEHLNCSMQNRDLLKDVSLNLYAHEIFGILGLADAGKTLLADYLTGKRSIDSGCVYYNDVKIRHCENLAGKGLGVTHITKDTMLIEELTIAQNFYLAVKESSRILYSKRQATAFAQTCLNDLHVEISAGEKAGNLNKCHQHIISMCIAYHCHSPLIIVDDAMAGYAPQDILDFQKFLMNLSRQDIAVMVMTHNVEYATLLSDRIAILKDGRNIKVIEKEYFHKNMISKILLDSPNFSEGTIPVREKKKGKVNLLLPSVNHRRIMFEMDRGSIAGVFDPDNILCDALNVLRYENLESPVCFSEDENFEKLSSLEEALEQRVVILFEDYFFTTIFKNLSLKENIELFSLGRLSRGICGYISRRREEVFLKDSRCCQENLRWKKVSLTAGNSIERQKILLERLRMFNPRLVICIKAISHLDPVLLNMTLSSFQELAQSGSGVFVLCNDYAAFSRQFDMAFIVRNDKIETILDQQQLVNTDMIAKYLVSTSESV